MMNEEMDPAEIEDHIIAHQAGVIRKRWGEEQASNVNYGWGVDEGGGKPIVSSKIYGRGLILTTHMEGRDYVDSWDDYE